MYVSSLMFNDQTNNKQLKVSVCENLHKFYNYYGLLIKLNSILLG